MVSRELSELEKDPQYIDAYSQIAKLQKPILEKVSSRIEDALKDFLPNVKRVDVSLSDDRRHGVARREVEITVDDGIPTALSRKGDGVQSLAAIGLLRGLVPSDRRLVLALEEPESHLHPSAIHRLREVLLELSRQHQVFITTHCPVFVDRVCSENNIVVTASRAKPARSISEIRDVLGVRASDNLMHAHLVLLVEGESDRIAINALLAAASPSLAKALKSNAMVVEHLHGAGKLNYKISELTSSLCNVHCFLDNDQAGRDAASNALTEGLIGPADIHHATALGMKDSELEDLFDVSVYKNWVLDSYGVDVQAGTFRNNRKWSDRMADTFLTQGKQWTPNVAKAVKVGLSELVKTSPTISLLAEKSTSIEALVRALEDRILNAK